MLRRSSAEQSLPAAVTCQRQARKSARNDESESEEGRTAPGLEASVHLLDGRDSDDDPLWSAGRRRLEPLEGEVKDVLEPLLPDVLGEWVPGVELGPVAPGQEREAIDVRAAELASELGADRALAT
jgi:hypothetical protein